MDLQTFLLDNLIWLLTIAFAFGGMYYFIRSLDARLQNFMQRHEAAASESKDALEKHSGEISELKVRVAELSIMASSLQRMETRIDDVWKHVMRQSSKQHHDHT